MSSVTQVEILGQLAQYLQQRSRLVDCNFSNSNSLSSIFIYKPILRCYMRFFILLSLLFHSVVTFAAKQPNVILVMADDMGYGQTGYYNHPVLQTPHLDAMAANGVRFDRFYAGAPNCSPTRATVLTGRTNDRTGVHNHGYAINKQKNYREAFQKLVIRRLILASGI